MSVSSGNILLAEQIKKVGGEISNAVTRIKFLFSNDDTPKKIRKRMEKYSKKLQKMIIDINKFAKEIDSLIK